MRFARLALLTVAGFALGACGDDSTTEPGDDLPEPTPSAGAHLLIKIQPAAAGSNKPLAVQPVVELRDTTGNVITSDNTTIVSATVLSGAGTLQGETAVTAADGIAAFTDLSMSAGSGEYRLTFVAEGVTPDTSVPFPITPGMTRSTAVGIEGGSVALADGASIVIPQGAIDGRVVLEFADTSGVEPEFESLSDYGYNLLISSIDPNTSTHGDSITLLLRTVRQPSSSSRSYIRAVFAPLPSRSFWATAATDGANAVTVSIPASALKDLSSLLGGRVLLHVEEAAESSEGSATPAILSPRRLGEAATHVVGCHEYPLRWDESSKVPEQTDVGVVLVHGWHPWVDDCDAFSKRQDKGDGIPGEVYFASLRTALTADDEFRYPLYVFTYPTFVHYAVAGDTLAKRLRTLQDAQDLSGFILVAHSMGGLVARSAVATLEADEQYAGLSRAIITLGTPHLGSPFALVKFFGVFVLPGLGTPGGQSLRPESAPPFQEEVPIVAYGGDMAGRDLQFPEDDRALWRDILFYAMLCDAGECSSDGLVPLQSAVPSFITQGRRGPVLEYTHSELADGFRLEGATTDTLYQSIIADLIAIAPPEVERDVWTRRSDFGGTARAYAVGFAIDGKGYLGTGEGPARRSDFWQYDPQTDTWTQMADFGGSSRSKAVGFSIGTRGYVGTGTDGAGRTKDFWVYDPTTNAWTRKADFGGTARELAVGFAVDDKGYIGTGFDGSFRKDFWEYDPASDRWTRKGDLGGSGGGFGRHWATGFSIGMKGYIGLGHFFDPGFFGHIYFSDLWEYDPSSDSWTEKQSYPGAGRVSVAALSVGSDGYVGTGYASGAVLSEVTDFWRYDAGAGVWTRLADFGGAATAAVTGFSIGNLGYLGTGVTPSYKRTFWEYRR